MTATAMTEREMGPGERAMRKRQRLQRNFLIGCALFGAVIGGMLASGTAYQGGLIEGLSRGAITVHPMLAITLAIGLLIGLVALPIYGFLKIDEVKVKRNLWSMAAGWFVVIGGYPAWAMLAAGGLMPQPTALPLFAATYAATLIAFTVQWLRDR